MTMTKKSAFQISKQVIYNHDEKCNYVKEINI